MTAIETVIKEWKDEGIRLLPPLEVQQVRETLNTIGRPYSSDIVLLYTLTGGMESEMDSHFLAFWSLERLLTENAKYRKGYISFADFLIDSHFYCFRYESEERSSVCIDYLNRDEPETLAGTVEDFFEILIKAPGSLMMFD